VLGVAQRDPIMVGVIGNLELGKPEFPQYFERYHKNQLSSAGSATAISGDAISRSSRRTRFHCRLKLLAEADLVMDTANPRVPLLEAMIRISDAVPALRIVLDTCRRSIPAERAAYERALKEIGTRPRIYVKLSEIIHRVTVRSRPISAPIASGWTC
jgi:predicted TIM-barrel fold metal-dependent hydrolase